jgi:hypothetical protein
MIPSSLNFAGRDRAFPGGLALQGPAWASNSVVRRMDGPTTGSMSEYDQRWLATSFADSDDPFNPLKKMRPTWEPVPAAGIASTPKSNMSVNVTYGVDQRKRDRNDIFPEELCFSVGDSNAYSNGRMPLHIIGLHTVQAWLDSDEDEARELALGCSGWRAAARFRFIGSLLSNPWPTTDIGQPKTPSQETYAMQGRARLQDIWGYQSESQTAGMVPQEHLSLLYTRRDKKLPKIVSNPRHNQVLQERQYRWCVLPVSHTEDAPLWHLYNSDFQVDPITGMTVPGGVFRGWRQRVGLFWQDLTMQDRGPKNFYELGEMYLQSRDPTVQYESYKQMRSIEAMIRMQ